MTGRNKSVLVEILQVDTCDSQELLRELSVKEKAQCQDLMRSSFIEIVRQYSSFDEAWNGDGGFCYFPSDKEPGLSIKAGETFLNNLFTLNAKTARAISKDGDGFCRSIRISAHRGEVYRSEIKDVNSAKPDVLDGFLKFEKKFAPKPNCFFITQALYDALPHTSKERFGEYKKIRHLKTTLYLMKRKPIDGGTGSIFSRGDEVKSITEEDWKYLRGHIYAQKVNIAARNSITTGLEKIIRTQDQATNPMQCFERLPALTLQGLYNYLRTLYNDVQFGVSYWSLLEESDGKYLQKVYGHPPPCVRRKIRLSDGHGICKAFETLEPVITPSVRVAANKKEWKYFGGTDGRRRAGLESAVQFPVYARSQSNDRLQQGVLSIHADKPEFFLEGERSLLREEFLHYLANLSLATTLLKHFGNAP